MTPLERACLHFSAALTAGSGLGYGWFRYFGQRLGEFGLEPDARQAFIQHLHILVAPCLLFTLGVLVRGHILPMLRRGGALGRLTGVGAALLIAPMVVSGYVVQVVTAPDWRVAWAWVHGVSSLLFLAGYGIHLVRTWQQARLDRDQGLD